jgi:hypothetical protein
MYTKESCLTAIVLMSCFLCGVLILYFYSKTVPAITESIVASSYVSIGKTRLFVVECQRTNPDGTTTRYSINCPHCNGK